MNFDRDNQSSQFGDSAEQNFNIPPRNVYVANAQESQISNNQPAPVQVDPFVPPEYEQIDQPEEKTYEQFEDREIINWQSQDMIIGEKNKTWYIGLAIVAAVLFAVSYFMESWSFAVLVAVSIAAIIATRQSSQTKTVSYSLSTRGVYVNNSFYPYEDFKYFGILRETGIYSIVLVPKKRFAPSTSIYFSKEYGEKITDIIGQRLPMEEVKHDIIDRIIRKIKL